MAQREKHSRKWMIKSRENLWDLQDTIKRIRFCIIRVLEGGERNREEEQLFEGIMAGKLPKS